MHAVTYEAPGGPEVLKWSEVPTPTPNRGEVRIRVAAAGVNRADLLQRQGFYPPPPGASDILGLEVSGVIDQVGPEVDTWKPGDPVVALLAGGGYAEQVVVPAPQCAPFPPTMGLLEAGGCIETAATVVSNFDHIGVQPGETILIHGGAGGIGSFAIPYAKALGLTVITTVGNEEKAEYVTILGADFALDYHDDWVAGVREATGGRGVDAILDIVGAAYLENNVRLLAQGGRLVVIGLQGGRTASLDLNRVLMSAATVTATSLRARSVEDKGRIVKAVADRVWPLYEHGQMPSPPYTFIPMSSAEQAHRHLESGNNLGKIILVM